MQSQNILLYSDIHLLTKNIKICDEAYQFLGSSSNPKNVFVEYLMNIIEYSNALKPIMKSECRKGNFV